MIKSTGRKTIDFADNMHTKDNANMHKFLRKKKKLIQIYLVLSLLLNFQLFFFQVSDAAITRSMTKTFSFSKICNKKKQ